MKPLSDEQLEALDALICYAYGELCYAGYDANKIIAELAHKIGIYAICQGEVAYYLKDLVNNKCIPITREMYEGLSYKDPRGPDYINSFQVTLAALLICKQRGWKNVGIMTNSDHQRLCYMTAKKMGLKPFIVDCRSVKNSPLNKQRWVQERWLFVLYSIGCRGWFLLHDWI
jgi:hypothetical protein